MVRISHCNCLVKIPPTNRLDGLLDRFLHCTPDTMRGRFFGALIIISASKVRCPVYFTLKDYKTNVRDSFRKYSYECKWEYLETIPNTET